jgi:NADH-quinone oxidoreductase subunit M
MGYYLPIIILTAVVGIVIPYIDLFVRLDYKILIALSSITHMNMTSVGIFSLNFSGMGAGIIISISHGLNSISLFLFAGLIINKSLSHYLDSL